MRKMRNTRKINRGLLAALGVQTILNFVQNKPSVDLKFNDLLLSDFREFSPITMTDKIQIKWREKETFLRNWNTYADIPPQDWSRDRPFREDISSMKIFENSESDKLKFFEERLKCLDEKANLREILSKSKELGWELKIKFYAYYPEETKAYELKKSDARSFFRGPTGEFFANRLYEGDSGPGPTDTILNFHPSVEVLWKSRSINVCVQMNKEFKEPKYFEVKNDAGQKIEGSIMTSDTVHEMLNFANSLPDNFDFVGVDFYKKFPKSYQIGHINSKFVFGLRDKDTNGYFFP
eukprot:GHVP01018418.1.p1 GENE.GHVP01018418.1~~GHVP01018418.1.p1  ORF type:complete len:301 (+),score=58.09 GHVP01018418.1:27-905(+)